MLYETWLFMARYNALFDIKEDREREKEREREVLKLRLNIGWKKLSIVLVSDLFFLISLRFLSF